jgi:hypothetical protein
MAEENLRSRHAFGSYTNVDKAIAEGKIDAYDILFLDGDTDPRVGWVDKNGNVRLVDNECVVTVNETTLPSSGETGKIYIHNGDFYYWNGTEFATPDQGSVTTEVVDTKVEEAVTTANSYTDEQIAAIVETMTIVEF